MRRKILGTAAAVVVVLLILTAFVALPVRNDLGHVRVVVSGSAADLEEDEIDRARASLQSALDRLESGPADVLKAVPILGANLDAVRASIRALLPVLDAAGGFRRAFQEATEGDVVADGKVSLPVLRRLESALGPELAALEDLVRVVADRRDGRVVPPLWNELDDLLHRAEALRGDVRRLADMIDISPALLGDGSRRTYLVMLLNNAELRGAGGILAALGWVSAEDGRLRLGRLFPYEALAERAIALRRGAEPTHASVAAPREYMRRFGIYKANTTLFINATYSADVPDSALVASRLFERVTGVATEGAIVVDPRGLAALMPEGSSLEVAGAPGGSIPADEVPRFVYSDAYDLYRTQDRRRQAILQAGRRAFQVVLDEGLSHEDALARAGDAVTAGHIRFVSFDDAEARVLDELGVTGNLEPVTGDSLLVASQNFGGGRRSPKSKLQGTKLDYWTKRHITHSCTIASGEGTCATGVSLSNTAPKGLTSYVAGHPYGLLRSYVDVFVPATARVTAVMADGRPAEFRSEEQAGRTAIGVYVEVPPGHRIAIRVEYRLDVSRGYRLTALPQPLANDATIAISLDLPDDWTTRGPGESSDGVHVFEGPFDRALVIRGDPDARTGLPGVWDSVGDFLKDPVL